MSVVVVSSKTAVLKTGVGSRRPRVGSLRSPSLRGRIPSPPPYSPTSPRGDSSIEPGRLDTRGRWLALRVPTRSRLAARYSAHQFSTETIDLARRHCTARTQQPLSLWFGDQVQALLSQQRRGDGSGGPSRSCRTRPTERCSGECPDSGHPGAPTSLRSALEASCGRQAVVPEIHGAQPA